MTAVDLARELLINFGGLKNLLAANYSTFCQQPGLGIAKYAQVQAALELSKRHLLSSIQESDAIQSPKDIQHYIASQLEHHPHEVFACLFLNSQYRIIQFEELFHGTIHSAAVYPRVVVKRALENNAASVILAHNHPSGKIEPSRVDRLLTKSLTETLHTVDIEVIDHIIVGKGKIFSFAERGLL